MKDMIILMVKIVFCKLVKELLWVKNFISFNNDVLNIVGIVMKNENLVVM